MKHCILAICSLSASISWTMQEQPTDFLVQTALTAEGKKLQEAGLIIEKTLDHHIDRADSPEQKANLILVRRMIKTQRHLLYAQEKGLLMLEAAQPQHSKLSRNIVIGGATLGALYALSRL